MAADTASRMPAAITPNTPKACLAIDAPFMSAGPRERPAESTVRGSAQKLLPHRLERLPSGLFLDAPKPPLGGKSLVVARCCPRRLSHRAHPVRGRSCGVIGVLHIGCACVGAALCTSP